MIVSHDPGSEAIADRVVRVRDGRLSQETVGDGEALVVGRGGWVQVARRPAGRGDASAGSPRRGRRGAGDRGAARPARRRAAADGTAGARRGGRRAASVHKSFGARTVFDGLSAEFHRGLLTTIAGRSGTGKSTLLHMLAGLERPGGGEVLVCGESLGRLDREGLAQVRRRHIAVVGHDPGLVAFMSAAENVALAASLRRRRRARRRCRAAACRRRIGRTGVAARVAPVGGRTAADGDRPRAGRRPDPDALVYEPTSRLDRANAAPVARLLARAAHERGIAVICATHDPLLAEHSDVRIPRPLAEVSSLWRRPAPAVRRRRGAPRRTMRRDARDCGGDRVSC